MGVAGLPVVAQLRHRPLLAFGDEDRVVAEALAATRLRRDPATEDAGPAELPAVRAEQDELADVARAAVRLVAELAQQPLDRRRALGRVARGANPGRAPERGHLEPGVLAEHPPAGRPRLEPVGRLRPRVL